jgi:hypothetical protein
MIAADREGQQYGYHAKHSTEYDRYNLKLSNVASSIRLTGAFDGEPKELHRPVRFRRP